MSCTDKTVYNNSNIVQGQGATDDEDESDVDAEEADDDYPATYKR